MQCAYVRFCKLDSWSNNDVDNDIFNFSLDRPRPVITRDFGKVREHSQTVWIGRFWGGFPKFTITHAICIVKLFKKGPDRHKKISKTCSTHGLWMPPWVRCATLITPQNIFWLKIVNTRMSRVGKKKDWHDTSFSSYITYSVNKCIFFVKSFSRKNREIATFFFPRPDSNYSTNFSLIIVNFSPCFNRYNNIIFLKKFRIIYIW